MYMLGHKRQVFNIFLNFMIRSDHYAYFYGISAESPGALLQFSLSKSDGDCLFMAYHMWGSQMGSLSVYVMESEKVSVTAFSGDQGNKWHCIGIDLLLQGPSTVSY